MLKFRRPCIPPPTGGYGSTPNLVHSNSVIVGHCTVQLLLSRAGMRRENALSDVMETRGERAHIVARTQRNKLGLRGPSVSARTNGLRYGPSRIASAGAHDGSTKNAL
jgi:hypothetical protein